MGSWIKKEGAVAGLTRMESWFLPSKRRQAHGSLAMTHMVSSCLDSRYIICTFDILNHELLVFQLHCYASDITPRSATLATHR